MDIHEQKLKQYLSTHAIKAEHLSFTQSCHSVAEAAAVVGASPTDFVKSICMIDVRGNLIVAIVKGEDKVSTAAVGNVLGVERPRIASPDEMLERTGYPCGGTPPFGYAAIFLIDARVMENTVVYAGGGSEQSLVKVAPAELQRANGGKVVSIRK